MSYITDEEHIKRKLEKGRILLEGRNIITPIIKNIGREIQELFKDEIDKIIVTTEGIYYKKYRGKLNKIIEAYRLRLKGLEAIDKNIQYPSMRFNHKGTLTLRIDYLGEKIEIPQSILHFNYAWKNKANERTLKEFVDLEDETLQPIDIETELNKLESYLKSHLQTDKLKSEVIDCLRYGI